MTFKKPDSLMTLKISSILAILFCGVLLMLCLTALNMSRELQVTPQFFVDPKYSGESSQKMMIYSLKDASGRQEEGQKILDEMLMRYYIQMRYEQIPDMQEMLFRWGRGGVINVLSTSAIYNSFIQNVKNTMATLPDIIQTVEIESLNRDKNDRGQFINSFTIDIVLRKYYPDGRKSEEEKKNIGAAFGYVKQRRLFTPYLTNPYGWTIHTFNEKQKSDKK